MSKQFIDLGCEVLVWKGAFKIIVNTNDINGRKNRFTYSLYQKAMHSFPVGPTYCFLGVTSSCQGHLGAIFVWTLKQPVWTALWDFLLRV